MAKAKKKTKSKTNRSPGRPCLLTPELQDQIVKYLHAGAYIETACAAAGIHKDTLYDWLKKGAAARADGRDDKFSTFSDAVEKAMAEAELADINRIGAAAVGRPARFDKNGKQIQSEIQPNWMAAAWRLERKFPQRYGRRVAMEHTGKDGKPIETTVTVTDVSAAVKEALEDASQAPPSEAF